MKLMIIIYHNELSYCRIIQFLKKIPHQMQYQQMIESSNGCHTYMVVNPYSYGVVARFFSRATVICSENDIPYLSFNLALEGEVKPKRRLLIVQNLMIINS